MTVKNLFENEELMNSIVEDIDDIPEDAEVTYGVWALCYDEEGDCVDSYFIEEFANPDEAVACAKGFSLETFNQDYVAPAYEVVRLSIEVETVVADPEDEDEGTMNIGTIYHRDILLESEVEAEDPIVAVGEDDYELLEDGTLKLSAKFMKGFNKNDMIRVQFLGEHDVDLLPYKIMSKVEYVDGDYYHCELMI